MPRHARRQAEALEEAVAKRQATAGELRAEERYLAARLPLDEQRQRHAAGRAVISARNAAMGLGPVASGGQPAAGGAGAPRPPQPHAPLSLVPQPAQPPGADDAVEAAGRELAQPLGAGRGGPKAAPPASPPP